MPSRFTPTVRQLAPFRAGPANRAPRDRKALARRVLALAAVVTVLLALAIDARRAEAAAGITAKVANDTLTITGDGAGNKLALRLAPGAPGTLQLDIGNDGSADRSFDRAAFTRIVVNADGGDDQVQIVESNSDDSFTDEEATTLNGQGGNDHLSGARNEETLSGGTGNDTLLGFGGSDSQFGGGGADTFVDNLGGGGETIDGGTGDDVVELAAGNAANTVTIAPLASAGPVVVDDKAGTRRDLVAVEALRLATHGGNDTIDAAAGTNLNLDVEAGAGNDLILSSDGDDRLVGGPGADNVAAGAGNDRLVWNNGDGNDRIEGDGGSDLLDVNGGAAAERFDVSVSGNRLRVFRDVASVALDAGAVERLAIESFGGRDVVTAPAAAPGLAALELTLEAADDGQVDTVFLTGSDAPDSLKVAPVAPHHVRVSSGAGRTVHDITRANELQLNAGGGNDQLTSTLSRAAFFTVLTLRGEGGNDMLTGGAASEALLGGSGNDTLRGGAGTDSLFGEDGNDALFGGADSDVLSGGLGIDRLDGGTSPDQISCAGPGDTVVPGSGDTINPDCT